MTVGVRAPSDDGRLAPRPKLSADCIVFENCFRDGISDGTALTLVNEDLEIISMQSCVYPAEACLNGNLGEVTLRGRGNAGFSSLCQRAWFNELLIITGAGCLVIDLFIGLEQQEPSFPVCRWH